MTEFFFYFKLDEITTKESVRFLTKKIYQKISTGYGHKYTMSISEDKDLGYDEICTTISIDNGNMTIALWPAQTFYLYRDRKERYFRITLKFTMEIEGYVKTPILLEAIRLTYENLRTPGSGFSDSDADGERGHDPTYDKSVVYFDHAILYKRVWGANLFTPVEVKSIGREKLLNAPCKVIQEWPDGAIFMMIHEGDFTTAYNERQQLREYLGIKGGL